MSGIIGINRSRGGYKAGDVIQIKSSASNSDISTSTNQQVVFGCTSADNLMLINKGNYVGIHVHFQVYTGGNGGGYCWVSRGLGRNNSASNTVRDNWYSHDDNLSSSLSDGSSADVHVYTTSGGYTHFHNAMNFIDTNPAKYTTNVRYSLALGCHSFAGSSVTIAGSWTECIHWTLTEIQA